MPTEPSVVLITGVSRGLGRELARGFAQRGARVIGCARRAAPLAELGAELGAEHAFSAVDIADDAAVGAWLADVETPDLVINNAALMNDLAPAWEIDAASFDALMHVNVGGTMNVIRHLAPRLIARGSGVIANFSSGWGRSTSPEVAPYCASKWAIEGLTRALAQELPAGVAAVAVNPGIIDTEMLRQAWGEGASAYPAPERWAPNAVERLARLGPSDSGRSVDL